MHVLIMKGDHDGLHKHIDVDVEATRGDHKSGETKRIIIIKRDDEEVSGH